MAVDIRVAPSSIAELLDDLARVPHLPGARCRGQSELFDRTVGGAAPRIEVMRARREALRVCRDCPALQACADWVDTIPPFLRPRSVVAGRAHAWLEERPAGMALTRTRWSTA
jgi:WhiB family redox-sensing transcriptional regulator